MDVSLLDGLASTRAIRRYTDEPVDEADLNRMLFAATRAPTGSNRQGFRFLVLRDGPAAAEAYPACQNLLLSARALGYGGVLTMWHQQVEEDLRAVLAIPEDFAIAACIPIGRPAGRHGPVRRRPLAELVFDDRWDTPAPWAVDPDGTRFTSAGPPRR